MIREATGTPRATVNSHSKGQQRPACLPEPAMLQNADAKDGSAKDGRCV